MILYEFEVKELLEKHGVPVEESCLASKIEEVDPCIDRVPGPPYVVKAQVRRWGRGKAGLVKILKSRLAAKEAAAELIEKTGSVLISRYVTHRREVYLALLLDETTRRILLLASESGGVNVEEAAEEPLKIWINPLEGLKPYMKRMVSYYLDLPLEWLSPLLERLYRVFRSYGLLLLEINPLAVSDSGLIAIDRKAVADDDAAKKVMPEYWERYLRENPPPQREALRAGISLVILEGDIAVVGNGAGLTMATMDLVELHGGRPGLFLDIGGGASSERVRKALELCVEVRGIKSMVINILGGITRCDEVARGLIEVISGRPELASMVFVRLAGLNEEEGRRMLREAGINVYADPLEAVLEAVRHAGSS